MTTPTWAIRPATPADAQAITHSIETCGMFSPEEAEGFTGMLPDLLSDPGALWRVALRGEALQGAAYATRDGMSEDVWNLWFLGLAADAQGQRGGAALLTAMEDAVRKEGARLMLIETSSGAGFAPARGLYTRRGYTEQGRIADYYGAGEAKVIFAKPLA